MRNFMILFTLWIASGQALGGIVSTHNTNFTFSPALEAEMPFEGYKGETIFEDVDFIKGAGGAVNNIGKLDSGWYQLTLTDFVFPVGFQDLRVAVTTATSLVSVLSLENGLDQAVGYLELNNQDSYYLSLYGQTEGSGYGLYGLQLSKFVASPVPVPASIVLLMSGLIAWGATGLRRRRSAGQY